MRAGAEALAGHPSLWPSAATLLAGLVPSGWWRRPPFLPLPDRRWLAFRMETAYGDPAAVPPGGDLVAYLVWQRAERARRQRIGGSARR